MNYLQALSEAVDGARVRAVNMQEGAYVDYNFNGWRINFPGGSSSGWHGTDIDRASDWEVIEDEPPKPVSLKQWGERLVVPVVEDRNKWGRKSGVVTPVDTEVMVQDPATGNWQTVAPNVGIVPARDDWGRPLPLPGKWGK